MNTCKACERVLQEYLNVVMGQDGVKRAWVGVDSPEKYIARFSLQAHHDEMARLK